MKKKTKISGELSVGEVMRTEKDWWMFQKGNSFVTTETLKNGRLLLTSESNFSGMVGENITVYSYAVLEFGNEGFPEVTAIKSVEDFKREVYPFQYKKERIASWVAMKNGTLFGESEDPRPYIY